MAATAAGATYFLSPLSSTHSILSSFTSTSTHKIKPLFYFYSKSSTYPPPISCLTLSKQNPRNGNCALIVNPQLRKPRNLRASASSEDAAVTAESAVEEIVSASTTNGDDGVSNIISILLFIAFIGLSLVTIGVIYIGVTDFLQKREKEKFEREEAANNAKKKKSGKRGRARSKIGPKGFGQKFDEDDD